MQAVIQPSGLSWGTFSYTTDRENGHSVIGSLSESETLLLMIQLIH